MSVRRTVVGTTQIHRGAGGVSGGGPPTATKQEENIYVIDAMLSSKIPLRGNVVRSLKLLLSNHGGPPFYTATTQSLRGFCWPCGALRTISSGRGHAGDRERRQQHRRRLTPDQDQAPLQQQISWGKQIKDADADTVLALVAKQGSRFDERNLATAAHRVAKRDKSRRLREDPRVAGLAELCKSRIKDFGSQALANTAWAFATAGVAAPRLFEAIASEAPSRINEFNSQALANRAWAFAQAGVAAPQLFEAIASEAPSRIEEFDAQGYSNTADRKSTRLNSSHTT